MIKFSEILFITSKFVSSDIIMIENGANMFSAYKDTNIFTRIIRELIISIPFLPEKICYSKKILKKSMKAIVVFDACITYKYLLWLKKQFPTIKICFYYCNKISYASHLLPNEIPSDIPIWTYDSHDSIKYNINLIGPSSFLKKEKLLNKPKFDVFFVGKDKGRAEFLIKLEKVFNQMGLKTKFIITPNRKFSRKKEFYSREISYSDVLEYDKSSRSILNIIMPTQTGLTFRDYESMFLGIKLITNNLEVCKYDFYHPNNIFILGKDDLNQLPVFLNLPVVPIEDSVLHDFNAVDKFEEIVNC